MQRPRDFNKRLTYANNPQVFPRLSNREKKVSSGLSVRQRASALKLKRQGCLSACLVVPIWEIRIAADVLPVSNEPDGRHVSAVGLPPRQF